MVRAEMERRFGDRALIDYIDVSRPNASADTASVVDTIREGGLVYPVTILGDDLICDGAVSYPAILRAVDAVLSGTAE
jgi:disulfide oxidoreductase YuzD